MRHAVLRRATRTGSTFTRTWFRIRAVIRLRARRWSTISMSRGTNPGPAPIKSASSSLKATASPSGLRHKRTQSPEWKTLALRSGNESVEPRFANNDRCGSWMSKKDFGGGRGATLIQDQEHTRNLDSKIHLIGFVRFNF